MDTVLAADEAKDVRQVGVVNMQGRTAVWSGVECTPWFGHRFGAAYTIQGNMLTGPEVLDMLWRRLSVAVSHQSSASA